MEARWSVVPSPNPGFWGNNLYAVVGSSNDVWAVGYYSNGFGRTLSCIGMEPRGLMCQAPTFRSRKRPAKRSSQAAVTMSGLSLRRVFSALH